MAFDGSISITLIDKNPRLAKVVVSGFNADGENLIDILTLTLDSFYDIGIRRDLKIKTITWYLLATHATAVTDVVSFKLMTHLKDQSEIRNIKTKRIELPDNCSELDNICNEYFLI